ncbi:hypothetical protein DFH28DRAFT_116887 [Melampsora americana]|nr:hypothetical protein DFH28DRAFT_116887 [Melampsora americana]
MRRGRKPKSQSIGTTVDRKSTGTFHIGGTSTRPLITFTDDQRSVILEDKPHLTLPSTSTSTSTSISISETTPKSFVGEIETEDVKMEDDRVYCICKRMYDGRTMIACDRCDDWYHNDCVGINDDLVELVDVFICPTCTPGAERSTTWKTRCARSGCHSAARTLSKYCTDWCGLRTVFDRLERSSIDPLDFWDSVRGVNRPQAVIEVHDQEDQTEESISEINENGMLNSLRKELENIIDRKFHLDSQLQIVTSRLRYLQFAIHRWENMCIETARALASQDLQEFDPETATVSLTSTVKPKKGPAKGKARGRVALKKPLNGLDSATGSNEAPCGFDVRLVWDDRDWIPWASSDQFSAMMSASNLEGSERTHEGVLVSMQDSEVRQDLDQAISEGVICLIMKKRCDRHMGWQKTRENDFETERGTLTRSIKKLNFEEQKIRNRIEEEEMLKSFKVYKKLNPKTFNDHDLIETSLPIKKKTPGRKKKIQKMKKSSD